MTKFFLFFSIFLASCGPQPKSQAEVTVTYNGIVESYSHPDFNTEAELVAALKDNKIPDFIIFSSPFCGACNDLKRIIKDLGWREKIIVLNYHEKWVNLIGQTIGINAVPAMVIDKDKGQTISKIFIGTGEISRQLFLHLGDNKKKGPSLR